MKRIPLSQGKVVTVDDDDYPLLADVKWCYRSNKDGTQGYAVRHVKVNGKDRLLYLHRHLMQPVGDTEVIFLNHDRLDCRKGNLRIVSHEEARHHHRVRRDSKSGVKGVRYDPDTDTYSAYVYRSGRCYHIGTFGSKEAASLAYETEIRKGNPGLHQAPPKAESPSNPGPVPGKRQDPPSLSA